MNSEVQEERKALEGWKEISAHLQRDAKTARRWEKEEGLPIHRHSHNIRSSVYAYPDEIDSWRAGRKAVAEPRPAIPLWRSLLSPPFAAAIVLCLATVGSYRAMEAQIKELVCSGIDCVGSISPDGKSLLIGIRPNAFVIRDIATLKEHVIEAPAGTRLIGSLFSPDGLRVAYLPSTAGQTPAPDDHVIVVNRDGTNSHPVNVRGGDPRAWSADGKRLLVVVEASDGSAASLQWVTLSNGAIQKLPLAHRYYTDIKVSPDGKYLAFDTTDDGKQRSVQIMASDGSGEALVAPNPTRQDLVGWTPDGKNLLFHQTGPAGYYAVRVSNGRIQAAPVKIAIDIPEGASSVQIDRMGTIYYRNLNSDVDQAIATLSPSTGKITSSPQPLPLSGGPNNLLPRFSPDGKRLVYYHKKPAATTRLVKIYSFDTRVEDAIETRLPGSGPICWTGDGQSVLMNANKSTQPLQLKPGTGQRQIEPIQIDLKSRTEKELFPGASSFVMSSCSGDLLVGTDPAFTTMRVRNWRSGDEKEVYKFAARQNNAQPALSRDGTQIAFFEQLDSETTVLEVVPSTGGPVRRLATAKSPEDLSGYCAAWSPDNRFVYFCKHERDNVAETFRVSVDGGSIESTGYKGPSAGGIEISPDGTRIISGWGHWNEQQIWTIRNFLPSR